MERKEGENGEASGCFIHDGTLCFDTFMRMAICCAFFLHCLAFEDFWKVDGNDLIR